MAGTGSCASGALGARVTKPSSGITQARGDAIDRDEDRAQGPVRMFATAPAAQELDWRWFRALYKETDA